MSDWMDDAMASLTWAMKAKEQMQAKGLRRAKKKCPKCGELATLILAGPKDHIHAGCPTEGCLRIME